MTRATNLAAIHAAELKVAQSMQITRDGLRRVRIAFRANLVRPSKIVLIGGAAGLFAWWLARSRQVKPSDDRVGIATNTSVLGFLLVLIVRYGLHGFPFILRQIRDARQRRTMQAATDMSKSPDSGYSPTGVLH
jgi:hypothetical protein